MIEFALIMPVLLLLLVGIIKFGLMYNNYITLTNAVRVGSRQLALGRGLPDPCTPAVTRTVNSAKPNLALSPSQVTVTLLSPDTCGSGSNALMIQGNEAKISATYPCDLVVLGINFYPGCTLKASASEAIE
jgi:hypothetical protein